MNYLKASNAIKKIAPDMLTMKRVLVATHISNLYQFGHTRFSLAEMSAMVWFMKMTGDIDQTQYDGIMALLTEAEKERED